MSRQPTARTEQRGRGRRAVPCLFWSMASSPPELHFSATDRDGVAGVQGVAACNPLPHSRRCAAHAGPPGTGRWTPQHPPLHQRKASVALGLDFSPRVGSDWPKPVLAAPPPHPRLAQTPRSEPEATLLGPQESFRNDWVTQFRPKETQHFCGFQGKFPAPGTEEAGPLEAQSPRSLPLLVSG